MFQVKRIYLLLALILIIGAVLRFGFLGKFPIHLGHDEISQLYDAISIKETGKDIYGNFLPFIFPSVNDNKPPFYTYATVVALSLFGGEEYVIRIPSAFFGSLVVVGVFLFTAKLFKNNNLALLASFITAISPFEIFYSRKSFENGAGIFLMLVGFTSLMHYVEKKYFLWMISGLFCLSVAMYTYFSHAVVIPIMLFLFLVIYSKEFLGGGRWELTILGVGFWLLVSTPLFYLVSTVPSARERPRDVFISQDVSLGSLSSFFGENYILRSIYAVDFAFDRYLKQFDPAYLYLFGLDLTDQGWLGVGPIFAFLLPLTLIGIFLILKKENSKTIGFITCWTLVGMIPSGLTFEEFSPHRVVMVFVMINIISAYGVYFVLSKLRRYGAGVFVGFWIVFLCGLGLSLLYFLSIYTVNYPREKSVYIHDPFKDISLFAWASYNGYDQIIIDPKFGDSFPTSAAGVQYYLAYYGNVDPVVAQSEYRNGRNKVERLFGKFSIRAVDWRKDYLLANTLLIVSPWSVQEKGVDESRIVKRFYFRNGNLAYFAVSLKK